METDNDMDARLNAERVQEVVLEGATRATRHGPVKQALESDYRNVLHARARKC